jgi:hypothetical protein
MSEGEAETGVATYNKQCSIAASMRPSQKVRNQDKPMMACIQVDVVEKYM